MNQLRGTALKRFARDFRRAHPLEHDVVLVLQSVAYPVNVGSLFRIADACGVTEVVLTGITPTPPNATISKVGRNRDHDVHWRHAEQAEPVLGSLRQAGYHICALELTDEAVPYNEFDYPARFCLVLGNEDHGVTRSTLAVCDSAIFVPMYGKGKSMNVHVAAAVALYHLQH